MFAQALARRFCAGYRTPMETPDEVLDATGLLCPLPVLKARKRLSSLARGQLLEVRATDPAARVDIPHFCAEQGHELVAQSDQAGDVLVFLLRKG